MRNFTITVVGAGVIGTSLGLALKQNKEAPRLLTHDKELEQARAAVKQGAFDKAEWNLINACEQADLIILAIPLGGIRPTLEAIGPYLKEGAVISDTARSKVPALTWATEILPAHVHFVGGDPLVHPAGSGQAHASAELFRHRLYCLTPAPSADETAVQLLVQIVALLGAEPYFLDAQEHDGLITAVDTLPTLAGVALMNAVTGQSSWREMRKLAGSLFEQVSLGANSDPDSLKDSMLTHRETVLHWLDRYLAELRAWRVLLSKEEPAAEVVTQKLNEAMIERRTWLADFQRGRFDDPELAPPKIERPGLMRQLIGFGGGKKPESKRERGK